MMHVSVFLGLYGDFNMDFTNVHGVELKEELIDEINYYKVKCYRIDNTVLAEFSFILHKGKYIKHGSMFVYYIHGSLEDIMHFKYGKLHNEEGPAYYRWESDGTLITKGYCIDGKLHREDGPARYICYNYGSDVIIKTWFYHGEQYEPALTKKAISI